VPVFCHLVNDWTSWLQPLEISVKQGSRERIARFAHNCNDELTATRSRSLETIQ
jgi:hypothetical protein